MSQVILIAGSANPLSRSTALLKRSATTLAAHGIESEMVSVADFPPQALINGWKHNNEIASYLQLVARASAVIAATPIYKAAYSGSLKLLLDLLPERAFAGKPVLPLAVGGSAGHLLALDYALRPVIGALKPKLLLDGVYAVDAQVAYQADGSTVLDEELQSRLNVALERFIAQLPTQAFPRYDPGLISQRVALAQLGI